MPTTLKPKQTGFSLLELLITVAIISILAMMAAPSFKSMLENNQTLTLANQLISAFNYARSEAVKRRQPVTVCARNAGGNGCSSTDSFKNGWIVYVGTTPPTVGSSTSIIGDTQIKTGNMDISGSSATIIRSVTYTITGSAKNSGSLYISSNGVNKRKIVIAMNTGRVRACRLPEGESECAD
jgi:type IV fimbrial biogenesis protein FimT